MKKFLKKIILYSMNKGVFNFISDEKFLRIKYKLLLNKKLSMDNPQTFNEKLQWLKLYDRKEIYKTMVDKYEAKKYVADIIGEEYIIPTLGVWNSYKEIDFDRLPNKFVLKPTHTSGNIFICNNKNEINHSKLENDVCKWLKRKYYTYFREWPYKDLKPRIIAEKCMTTETQKELIDYKFFCFNGIPKFLYVSEGLSNHKTAKMNFVDMNYEKAKFWRKDYKQFEKLPEKPVNFEKMKELAKILAKDIPFVRVDFYEIDEKIFFGELTFFPCAGFLPFEPEQYDRILGEMLQLPREKVEGKNEK